MAGPSSASGPAPATPPSSPAASWTSGCRNAERASPERRPCLPLALAALLTAGAVAWAAVIPLVTRPAMRDRWPVVAVVIHAAAGLVCHQRADRSFYLDGTRMPVCARCAGLYAGGAMGTLLGWLVALRRTRAARAALLFAAVPTAATVAAEWAGLAAPSNVARAVLALPLGAVAAWAFVRLLRDEGVEPHRL